MQTRQPNLEGHGEIRLRRLVTKALRMRPSRMIVGEVGQEESLDMLVALNSGLPGKRHTRYSLNRPRPVAVQGLRASVSGPRRDRRRSARVAVRPR